LFCSGCPGRRAGGGWWNLFGMRFLPCMIVWPFMAQWCVCLGLTWDGWFLSIAWVLLCVSPTHTWHGVLRVFGSTWHGVLRVCSGFHVTVLMFIRGSMWLAWDIGMGK
jgi:hypothetical protein